LTGQPQEVNRLTSLYRRIYRLRIYSYQSDFEKAGENSKGESNQTVQKRKTHRATNFQLCQECRDLIVLDSETATGRAVKNRRERKTSGSRKSDHKFISKRWLG